MTIRLKISGKFAHFAKKKSLADPLCWAVPPPPAIEGMISSVFWEPEMTYQINWIALLNPIRYMRETVTQTYCPSSARLLRTYELLYEPSFLVDVYVKFGRNNVDEKKRMAILMRRLLNGQHYKQPYLGISDYPAMIELLDQDAPMPAIQRDINLDLGQMPLCWQWEPVSGKDNATTKVFTRRTSALVKDRPLKKVKGNVKMFDAKIVNGVLEVPKNLYPDWGCDGYSI